MPGKPPSVAASSQRAGAPGNQPFRQSEPALGKPFGNWRTFYDTGSCLFLRNQFEFSIFC